MPLSHRRLSNWYTQLAQQLEAGVPLAAALRGAGGTGVPAATLDRMVSRIAEGGATDDALRAAETWLPESDKLTLSAAAEAGRMPQTLRQLAARHAQLGAAQIRVVLACLYPLGILHVGLLLMPVVRMIDWHSGFHWSTPAYVRGIAVTLIPLWTIIAVVVALAQQGSPMLRRLGRALPAIRGYLIAQARADLAFALGNFLEAGVPIGDAWATAGLISTDPDLRQAADALAAAARAGQPPGARIAAWPCFPPEFAAQYRTGETTGRLDETLSRLATDSQDAANRALTLVTLVYPALAFLIVAGCVTYGVVNIYAGYLKMITSMGS